jgi:two-component system, LuxR family, response regulator FixJ
MPPAQSTVYVVDDAPQDAQSFGSVLEASGRRVVSYRSARELLATFQPEHPCCLVLDLKEPEPSELGILHELHARHLHICSIIVTGHIDGPTVPKLMRLGAVDIHFRPVDPNGLLAMVNHILAQDATLERQRQMTADARQRLAGLTRRERQLFDLVVGGKSYKEMAATLGISPRTVEHHRAHIANKLGMDRIADLVRLGIYAGEEQCQPTQLVS